MTPEQEEQRGNLASQVANNPVFRETMLIINARLVDELTKTKANQSAERDEIWRQLKTLEKIEKQINSVMKNGRIAKQTLAERLRLSKVK